MSDDRLLTLLDAWRDRTLDATGADELRRRLTDDPSLLREVLFDRHLAQACDDLDGQAVLRSLQARLEAESRPLVFSPTASRPGRFVLPRLGRPPLRVAMVALLGLACVLLLHAAWTVLDRQGDEIATTQRHRLTIVQVDAPALVRRGPAVLDARSGLVLHAGDRVEAAPAAGLVLGDGDGTRLTLAAGARLAVDDWRGEVKRLDVLHGRVVADVAHQTCPFTVNTGLAGIEVVGTRFAVTHLPDLTRLEMRDGAVGFGRHGQPARLVRSGEALIAAEGDGRGILAAFSLLAAGDGRQDPLLGTATTPLRWEGGTDPRPGLDLQARRVTWDDPLLAAGALSIEAWFDAGPASDLRLDFVGVPLDLRLNADCVARHLVVAREADGGLRIYGAIRKQVHRVTSESGPPARGLALTGTARLLGLTLHQGALSRERSQARAAASGLDWFHAARPPVTTPVPGH